MQFLGYQDHLETRTISPHHLNYTKKQLLLLLPFHALQRRLTASMQNLQPARLLVGRDVDLGLGPLAGRNLALEQNVDLAV